jgi:hypothetical protein
MKAKDLKEFRSGEVNAYCDNPGCPVHEVDLVVKILDEDEPLTTGKRFKCPWCLDVVVVEKYLTVDEVNERDERNPRWLVNMQRYRRDHPNELGVPASVMFDETLPA